MENNKIYRNKLDYENGRHIYWKLQDTHKKIKEDTNQWKDIPYLSVGRLNNVKISVIHKAVYRFNASVIKTPMAFFIHAENILKFIWNEKSLWIVKSILRKKNKAGDVTPSAFSIYVTQLEGSKQCGTGIKTDI